MGVWDKFLPVKWEDSESVYKWSIGLRRSLHKLSQGPSVSDVRSGDTLAEFISQVADQDTDPETADGVAYYFDALVQPTNFSKKFFFEKTLPRMADLALRLPELLVEQSEQSKKMAGKVSEESKESGDGNDDGILLPLSLRVSRRKPSIELTFLFHHGSMRGVKFSTGFFLFKFRSGCSMR